MTTSTTAATTHYCRCGRPTHAPDRPRIWEVCPACERAQAKADDAVYLDSLRADLSNYADDDPEAARIMAIMADVEGGM